MINNPFKKAEAEKMIKDFSSEFFNKFGMNPVIVYDIDFNVRNALTLGDVEDIMNEALAKVWQKGHPYPTIRTRFRKREIVTYRQLYYYYARKEGYNLSLIGDRIGFDHASVIHGFRHIENLVKSEDRLLSLAVKEIDKIIALKHKEIKEIREENSSDQNHEEDILP